MLIRRGDGRVLMVRRAAGRPAPGYWTAVTGKVEPGEAHRAAALREVAEETGLAVTLVAEDVYRSLTAGGEFELRWFVAHASEPLPPLALLEQELAEARWLPWAEARALEPMFASTRAALDALCGAAPRA